MVISHKHKYVFVQFPRTACTAIASELVENYEGVHVLRKHSKYHELLRVSERDVGEYFVFSCIRNPLDSLISYYFKLKSNHNCDFTSRDRLKRNGGWVTEKMIRHFEYIQKNNASFEAFLTKFYLYPYVNWSVLDHKNFDFIIRYENLQEDFFKCLSLLGLEQVRLLPSLNKTRKDQKNITELYESGSHSRTVWIVGPMMMYWGYELPKGWGKENLPLSSTVAFQVMGLIKTFYWRHLK